MFNFAILGLKSNLFLDVKHSHNRYLSTLGYSLLYRAIANILLPIDKKDTSAKV